MGFKWNFDRIKAETKYRGHLTLREKRPYFPHQWSQKASYAKKISREVIVKVVSKTH